MADQPPLADGNPADTKLSDAQTETPSYLERVWTKMWTSEYKPHVLIILYVLFAVFFISISALSHSKFDSTFHDGFWASRMFHWGFFHTEFYDFSQTININGRGWRLTGSEVWEFYAILLTMIFSLLLLGEPEEKPGVGLIFLCAGLILFACILGIFCLGLHHRMWYQGVLLFIVLVLALVDGLMYRASKTREYRLLQFFVDIPMFISLCLLIFYVRLPVEPEFKEFFSGALAFQFIIGCLLVLLVRAHGRILQEKRPAPALLILIMWDPLGQILEINKRRRAEKKAAKTAARSQGISGGG